MEIEFGAPGKQHLSAIAIVSAVLLLVALAFLGRAVTPLVDGAPVLLSPVRWQAYGLAREAHAEMLLLQRDIMDLKELLGAPHADPVATLLLAQRIKATHHEARGTAVTRPARQALILAAQAAAMSASGSEPRANAVEAYNAAFAQVQRLAAPRGNEGQSLPAVTATPAVQP
jgi:hypothetical protein